MQKFTLIATALATAVAAWGLEVTTTPGNLHSVVSDTTVTELKVKGSINALDFYYINDSLRSVKLLDLSEASVAAYAGSDSVPLDFRFKPSPAGTVPREAFFASPITSVILPSGLTAVGEGAFAGARIESIDMPASVDSIADYAFNGSSLRTLTVPTARVIGKGVWAGCDSLTSVTVTRPSVPVEAFRGCKNLAEVNLGNGVTLIASGAFAGCPKITGSNQLKGGRALQEIADEAFAYSGLTNLDLTAFPALKTIGGWAFACTPVESVVLPDGVETVGEGAFYGDGLLRSVQFPAALSSLSNYALAGCTALGSDSIKLNSVTTIGDYALYNLTEARKIILPATLQHIGTKAMAGAKSLQTIVSPSEVAPTLGDSVWAGVRQANVSLFVHQSAIEGYGNAEQWKEFTIYAMESGSEPLAADASTVKAHFEGTTLVVASSSPMARVALHTLAGTTLCLRENCGEQTEIDTQNASGKVYVLEVRLANGTIRSFKLIR